VLEKTRSHRELIKVGEQGAVCVGFKHFTVRPPARLAAKGNDAPPPRKSANGGAEFFNPSMAGAMGESQAGEM
jgi:hypothetical protein